MSIRNGSGHDVEVDVEEGEPPPGPGVVSVPGGTLLASTAFTFLGGLAALFGCLHEAGGPLLPLLGTGSLGIAIGIQGYALAAGRRRVAPKRLVYGGAGKKIALGPGETHPYTFNPGDCVVFCWANDDSTTESLTSAPVLAPGALVELVELSEARLMPGGATHAISIT